MQTLRKKMVTKHHYIRIRFIMFVQIRAGQLRINTNIQSNHCNITVISHVGFIKYFILLFFKTLITLLVASYK